MLGSGTSVLLRGFHQASAGKAEAQKRVGIMLAIALSVLFGLIAFFALSEIHAAVRRGLERSHAVVKELAYLESSTRAAVRAVSGPRFAPRRARLEHAAA